MTRKDFKVIAKAVKEMTLDGDEYIREHIARELADNLTREYPNFDYDKFVEFCKREE